MASPIAKRTCLPESISDAASLHSASGKRNGARPTAVSCYHPQTDPYQLPLATIFYNIELLGLLQQSKSALSGQRGFILQLAERQGLNSREILTSRIHRCTRSLSWSPTWWPPSSGLSKLHCSTICLAAVSPAGGNTCYTGQQFITEQCTAVHYKAVHSNAFQTSAQQLKWKCWSCMGNEAEDIKSFAA